MASRAERGECSALYDGVVGARRAGALQAKRVVCMLCFMCFSALRLELPPLRSSLYKQRDSL